jgi:hypothetical protein
MLTSNFMSRSKLLILSLAFCLYSANAAAFVTSSQIKPPTNNASNASSANIWSPYTLQFIVNNSSSDWSGTPQGTWTASVAQCPSGTTWVGGLADYSGGTYATGTTAFYKILMQCALQDCSSTCNTTSNRPYTTVTGIEVWNNSMYGFTTWVECQQTLVGFVPASAAIAAANGQATGIILKDNTSGTGTNTVSFGNYSGIHQGGDASEYMWDVSIFPANGATSLVADSNPYTGSSYVFPIATAYTWARTPYSNSNPPSCP